MKRSILSVCVALAVSTVSFALPKLEELPGNLFLLSAAESKNGAFEKALAEKGLTPEAMFKLYSEDIRKPLENAGIIELLNNTQSYAIGITVDQKMLPNGFICYVEGTFDAQALIKRIIATPIIQEELAKDPAEEEVSISFGTSALGETLVFKANADKVPARLKTGYPPIADGFTVTLEATAPNTLRVVSSGARPVPGKTLSSASPFAAVAKLEGSFIARELIQPVDQVVEALLSQMRKAAPPGGMNETDRLMSIPVMQAFTTLKSVDARVQEKTNPVAVEYSILFTAANEDKATEIQEALIGYKVLAKTGLDMMSAQAPAELSGIIKPISDFLSSIKVSAPKDNTVTFRLMITFEQFLTLMETAEKLMAQMPNAYCAPVDFDEELILIED